jgi:CBS domain-containing protein
MTDMIAKDLMVPVAQYAVVPLDATLYDAIVALETAQKEFCRPHKNHLSVLVADDDGNIVGQVSQWDAIRALDAVQDDTEAQDSVSKFGLNPDLVKAMMVSHRVWNKSLPETCRRAATKTVRDFMSTPERNTFIEEEAPITDVLYKMVKGERMSLFVTRDEKIIGVIKVVDVLSTVCRLVKEGKVNGVPLPEGVDVEEESAD